MTYLGTWTYEKHPKTGKLIRIRKTTVRYSPPPERQPAKMRAGGTAHAADGTIHRWFRTR
jgi:hypothetical protein